MHHRGLRGTPRVTVGPGRVQAILDHVEVKAAHVHDAEVVQRLVDQVKLVALVGRDDRRLQPGRARDGPAVELHQVGDRHRVPRRIEAMQVTEQETRRVADAPV